LVPPHLLPGFPSNPIGERKRDANPKGHVLDILGEDVQVPISFKENL
jgi:hypothetical protein